MSVKDLHEVEIGPEMRDVIEWFCVERGVEAVFLVDVVNLWRWDEAMGGHRYLGRLRMEESGRMGRFWDLAGIGADGRRMGFADRDLDVMLHQAWIAGWGR